MSEDTKVMDHLTSISASFTGARTDHLFRDGALPVRRPALLLPNHLDFDTHQQVAARSSVAGVPPTCH